MSHFTVLVIGKNIEKQLKPYDENKDVKPYVKHNKRNAAKELAAEVARYENYVNGPDKENYNQERCKEQLKKYQAMTPAEYWEELCKYEEKENIKNGCIYSTYNPNSKWDWYSIGGRWTGFFKPKNGAKGKLGRSGAFGNQPEENHFDSMLKKDIDFEGMKAEERAKREKWWNEAQEKIKQGDKNAAWMFDIHDGDTKESYINRGEDGIMTFAVVKDGKWYEQAEMGWWGCTGDKKISDEEWAKQYTKLIDSLPDNTLLTVVDCHI
jgi:hypothetical protein